MSENNSLLRDESIKPSRADAYIKGLVESGQAHVYADFLKKVSNSSFQSGKDNEVIYHLPRNSGVVGYESGEFSVNLCKSHNLGAGEWSLLRIGQVKTVKIPNDKSNYSDIGVTSYKFAIFAGIGISSTYRAFIIEDSSVTNKF